jgi:hypothetical protein
VTTQTEKTAVINQRLANPKSIGELELNKTDKNYGAEITRVVGHVDPVKQTIKCSARSAATRATGGEGYFCPDRRYA